MSFLSDYNSPENRRRRLQREEAIKAAAEARFQAQLASYKLEVQTALNDLRRKHIEFMNEYDAGKKVVQKVFVVNSDPAKKRDLQEMTLKKAMEVGYFLMIDEF
ncbi:hypothetical protein P8452_62800 [Trifolium repens]|jgi:hypothetical protein|nr:hypothetical protein QL285_040849 [Trifolium repens]WJX79706.1 hypothetical protein P8452_62800 [Trifolium repens]